MCWYAGATLVLRSKFSASTFMQDCVTSGATVVFYIGQILRFLISALPSLRSHALAALRYW
jgi:hypothetical protein